MPKGLKMPACDKRLSLLGICIAGLSLISLSGCGGIGGSSVPVSGAVTLNKLPLPFALVVFHPEDISGRTVAAVTDIRGRYFLKEGERLGVPPGSYRVTVRYFTGIGDLPERPEPEANFSGENITQLLPPKYSDKTQTELNVLVLNEEADEPNSFIHELTGEDVPLPPRAQRRPQDGDEVQPENKPTPIPPSVATSSSTLSSKNLIIFGGGLLLFLLAGGGVFLLVSRRRQYATGDDYYYDGEMSNEADSPKSAEKTTSAPRRKKKRKKKKVRKKTSGRHKETDAPVPDEQSGDSDPAGQESEGSPFPVLDEGMDDDEMAAAFLAGDEETLPAPKSGEGEFALAKWMLEAGGYVKVRTGDEPAANVKKIEDLPKNNFHVQGAFFEGVEDFDDQQLAKIKKLPHLDTLDLASTAITDAGLKVLEQLPSLKTLALSRTAVTDEGLQHLTALPNLRILLLYRTKVSDKGVDQLKKLSKLKTVELKRTEISEEAAKKLQEALPDCKVIV